MTTLLPPPTAFGLPDKFNTWRPLQDHAVLGIVDTDPQDKRFIAQVQPTGSGKSLTYMAAAYLDNVRTCVLTSTKGLQTQLMDDFKDIGLVDIRGQNAYRCKVVESEVGQWPTMCDDGPCHAGMRCKLREDGCLYYDAVREATRARLVVTNYDYWMTAARYGTGLGEFEMLVLDEAHAAPGELADFCAVELQRAEVEGLIGGQWPASAYSSMSDWRAWASVSLSRALAIIAGLEMSLERDKADGDMPDRVAVREMRTLRNVAGRLEVIVRAEGDWVPEFSKGTLRLDPKWATPYAERYLFLGTPKVVLTSATIREKTMELIGVSAGECVFREYPSTFPVSRRPVVMVPTVRVNHRTTEGEMKLWLSRIDQIIRGRRDRNGLVHTVSYARRNLVMGSSEHRDIMWSHDTRNTRSTVEKFKRAKPPAVLVSPSIVTGWDFPYTTAEYQIIGKIGFPDTRPAVMQARHEEDREYIHYEAMQALVQACGRIDRAEDDQGETLVIDDNARWFVPAYRKFAPEWFWDAWRWSKTIPRPLAKLEKL